MTGPRKKKVLLCFGHLFASRFLNLNELFNKMILEVLHHAKCAEAFTTCKHKRWFTHNLIQYNFLLPLYMT